MQELLDYLIQAWNEIPVTYKGTGAILLGLGLMWHATGQGGRTDRMFFISGMLSLGLLAYGALSLINDK